MACYCQYCKYLYPAGTTNCYACGRPTSKDGSPSRRYLDAGFLPMGDLGDEGPEQVQNEEPSSLGSGGSAVQQRSGGESAAFSRVLTANTGRASTTAAQNSPTSVLQGEDIDLAGTGREENSSLLGETNAADAASDQVNSELQRLEAEERRQWRALQRLRRRQQMLDFFMAIPWRSVFRFLLLVMIGVGLVVAWKMRYAILDWFGSLLSALGSWLLSLLVAFLPVIILIYLVISLIRGSFGRRR